MSYKRLRLIKSCLNHLSALSAARSALLCSEWRWRWSHKSGGCVWLHGRTSEDTRMCPPLTSVRTCASNQVHTEASHLATSVTAAKQKHYFNDKGGGAGSCIDIPQHNGTVPEQCRWLQVHSLCIAYMWLSLRREASTI